MKTSAPPESGSKPLTGLVILYSLALITSMAGMEIFGWLIAAIGIFYTAIQLFRGRLRLKDLSIGPDLLIVAFISWGLLGYLVKLGELGAGTGKLRWIFLIYGVFWALRNLNLKWSWIKKWEAPFLIVSGLVGLYALQQFWTGSDWVRGPSYQIAIAANGPDYTRYRSIGFFNLPLTYGYSLGMVFAAIGAQLLRTKGPWTGLFYLRAFAFFSIGLSLVTTYTRGVWLAVGLAGLIMIYLSHRKWTLKIAIALALAVGLGGAFSPSFSERITSVFDTKYSSNSERIVTWKAAILMAIDHPVFGVGFKESSEHLANYYDTYSLRKGIISHAHSNYFEFLSNLGFVGLGIYLFLIFYFLRLSFILWKDSELEWAKTFGLGSFGAQWVVHLGGLTEVNFTDSEVQHLLLFMWALTALIAQKQMKINLSFSPAKD